MFIEYLGITIIFSVGVAGAVYIKKRFDRQLQTENELLKLIEYIRNKILFFREPVESIYSSFDSDVLSEIGFIDSICDNGWTDGMNYLKNNNLISKELYDCIYSFGNELGSSFSETEVKRCNYYISQAEKCITNDRETIPKTSKMISSLSIAISLLIALILY